MGGESSLGGIPLVSHLGAPRLSAPTSHHGHFRNGRPRRQRKTHRDSIILTRLSETGYSLGSAIRGLVRWTVGQPRRPDENHGRKVDLIDSRSNDQITCPCSDDQSHCSATPRFSSWARSRGRCGRSAQSPIAANSTRLGNKSGARQTCPDHLGEESRRPECGRFATLCKKKPRIPTSA